MELETLFVIGMFLTFGVLLLLLGGSGVPHRVPDLPLTGALKDFLFFFEFLLVDLGGFLWW